MGEKKLYEYIGPVYEYERCVQRTWKAQTYAVSEKRALNNLKYRWREENNLSRNTRVELPGVITIFEEE